MNIIPAIDLIQGRCVRLQQGNYNLVSTYFEDPLEWTLKLEASGVERIHMVDLDGARTGTLVNLSVLERITRHTKLIVDFSGGINNQDSLQQVWDAGATYAAIGSVAVANPEVFKSWVEAFGANRFLVGMDLLDDKIRIRGWLEEARVSVQDFLKQLYQIGIREYFCTDISKDGQLKGPSLNLYQQLMKDFPDMHCIASGGVSSMQDIVQLDEIGCPAVIVGKALLENQITLKELQLWNQGR